MTNDILDGKGGSDYIYGFEGDDHLTYTKAENSGMADLYYGNAGWDVLRINLTSAEFSAAGVSADLMNFESFLAANTNTSTVYGSDYAFATMGLTVSAFEGLQLYIDGVLSSTSGEELPSGGVGMRVASNPSNSPSLSISDSNLQHYNDAKLYEEKINTGKLNGADNRLYDTERVLFGSKSSETLTAQNSKIDAFIIDKSSFIAMDYLENFNVNEGDKLVLQSVLQGYDPVTDAIADFIQISQDGNNSILSIDANGQGNNFVQVATFLNTQNINEDALITNGSLVIS